MNINGNHLDPAMVLKCNKEIFCGFSGCGGESWSDNGVDIE